MENKLKLTIAIPTYNGALLIGETLESIFAQSFQNFGIVISDDCSTDNTIDVIESFNDPRISIHRNQENVGYGPNLQVLRKLARGDILFLMGQDDILLRDALLKTHNAFLIGDEVGVVTRPYYWFDEEVKKPVRAVLPYDPEEDVVIPAFQELGRNLRKHCSCTLLACSAPERRGACPKGAGQGPAATGREFSEEKAVQKIFESVGQLSGLAYRLKYMERDFHEHCFPAHIYPFAEITKKHKIVFLKDYTVAVRIASSQTRFKSSIYDISPTETWVQMFKTVYNGGEFDEVRRVGIEQMAKNYVGLVQLKNYSTFKNLLREILILIKLRPRNLLVPEFWFYSLGTLVVPRRLLVRLVGCYKNRILLKRLGSIRVEL